MIENGFYKVKQEFIDLIKALGGQYKDVKERPIYCCMKDKYIDEIYWAIPTSDLSHRNKEQIKRINFFISLPERDIRSCWYHIGHTNRPAIYKISSCLPVVEKYIDSEYISQGSHLILAKQTDIRIIRRKLARILFAESKHPNKFEQHITSIKNYLTEEISVEKEAAATSETD
jgi:hypothetical protein